VDFGALLLPNRPWPEVVAAAREAEDMGFRAAWVDDHVVNPRTPGQPWFESWTVLAGLAGRTERIALGTLVSNVVLRHPVLLARQAVTVEAMSVGRLVVGLGAGYAPTDHDLVGVPVWPGAERQARFGEAVQLVDRLLRGAPVTYRGVHYRVEAAQLLPAPVQRPRPPLCVAAHSDASLRVAARHGDIWSSFGGWGLRSSELLEVTRRRGAALDRHCAELGRDPRSVRRQVLAGSPATTPDPIWSSVDAFDTWVGGWAEAGIDEIVLYFPPAWLWDPELVRPRVLEHLARLLRSRDSR
jgi:alkanesulfonate monooxygenase SsuD/methylene tetrahydromethanopterin reductase-like flavin-dependent oxidoreductase (luciferase family)